MNVFVYKVIIIILFTSCGQVTSHKNESQPPVTLTGVDTCDDPDAHINCSFINMPTKLTPIMNITKQGESGEKMIITGRIFKADSRTPYPNVVLYAYHTDSKGYYSKTGKETGAQKWHGRLHGWCQTDHNGYYEIRTIRPARYPDNSMPAHIHIAVKEPKNKEPYYISDIVFKDDSLVNEQYLKTIRSMVGGEGIVQLSKSSNGTWIGQRDIILIE